MCRGLLYEGEKTYVYTRTVDTSTEANFFKTWSKTNVLTFYDQHMELLKNLHVFFTEKKIIGDANTEASEWKIPHFKNVLKLFQWKPVEIRPPFSVSNIHVWTENTEF